MRRFEFSEKKYTNINIFLFLLIIIYLEINKISGVLTDLGDALIFLLAGILIMILKTYFIEKGYLEKKYLYLAFKIAELLVISYLIYYHEIISLIASVIYLLIVAEMILQDFRHKSVFISSFFPIIMVGLLKLKTEFFNYEILINVSCIILISIIFIYVIDSTLTNFKEDAEKDKQLLNELQQKNKELYKKNNEVELLNKELQEQKEEMKKTVENFRNSVAELFILREISSYIGSILDIEQLLEMVCDMIMGIMGVDTCSIIVYNEKDGSLDFHIKSIYSQDVIEKFKEQVWSSFIHSKIKNKEIIMDNNSSEEKYEFLKGRKVGSLVAVPLYKANKTYGLILAEHSLENYFSVSSTDLFKAVSMQVTMAIENAKLYEQMEDIAIKDGLTKIYNRLYLQNILPQLVGEAIANKKPIAVSIFDIDHFKQFNDTYGHLFGDEVLKTVARFGQEMVDQYDGIIARYGGEEFFIILPDMPLRKAAKVIEEFRKKIENYELRYNGQNAKITASFGVSGYPEVADNVEELIKTADDAMYLSKRQGRNLVSIAPPNLKIQES